MVNHITFQTFAYPGAPEKMHMEGADTLRHLLPGAEVSQEDKPQLIMFLSGGSEALAIKQLDKNSYQVLLAGSGSNAFASAMEVKAYSLMHGYRNVLLNLEDGDDKVALSDYVSILSGLKKLAGQRLGLIGEVSEWLVASDISAEVLKNKLGIELIRIPWGETGNYRDHFPVNDFFEEGPSATGLNVAEAGKVSALLESVAKANKLDAITVECFSLVKENQVTACLGLSYLNDIGLPAGCEGDLCSVTGIMLVKELFGIVPWMANVAGITGNDIFFAHCTAPLSVLDSYEIDTHFETGEGTAIRGKVGADDVSIFRVNSTLDKFFIAHGRVVQKPYVKKACRTQLHVRMQEEKANEMKSLPLGNHHLILKGDWQRKLNILREIMGAAE